MTKGTKTATYPVLGQINGNNVPQFSVDISGTSVFKFGEPNHKLN